jgi:hypothetical protein
MRTNLSKLLTLMATVGIAAIVSAQEPAPPACVPGCNSCVPGHSCRMVTEMVPIKKVVYTTKCVPVCEQHPGAHLCHRLGHLCQGGTGGGCCSDTGCTGTGCGSNGCNGCGPTCKLFYKNVLIKKEIVVGHKCVTKCVVDNNCCVGQ